MTIPMNRVSPISAITRIVLTVTATTGHGHTHSTINPSILTNERGMWAVKWSFVGLLITTLLQAVVVVVSGSVALLADTIHNLGDSLTAIPLAIAFALARRKPSKRFSYGYGTNPLTASFTRSVSAICGLWSPPPLLAFLSMKA
jgi:Co/Zn/Cd efflux system component